MLIILGVSHLCIMGRTETVSSVGTSFYKEPRMTQPYSRDSPSLRA